MKRILIADDDADIRQVLHLALGDLFEGSLAANGVEVLRLLERETYDVLLLDLSMPVLDGRGVIRELRRRHIDVPVLILSAEADLAATAFQLHIQHFLRKPVELQDLRELLVRMTELKRPVSRTTTSGVFEVESP